MNKQNVAYPYDGILFRHNRKWASDIFYNVDEIWRNYAKQSKPVTGKINIVWFYLDEVPRVVKIIETVYEVVVARDWGKKGMKKYCYMDIEFQLCKKSHEDGW